LYAFEFLWQIYIYIYNTEDVSIAEMLFDDEYDDFTENIPLRPVGPAWRVVIRLLKSSLSVTAA